MLYGILLIPAGSEAEIQNRSVEKPFIWDQDERWNQLEVKFNSAENDEIPGISDSVRVGIQRIEQQLDDLGSNDFKSSDPGLNNMLDLFFEVAPYVAALDSGQAELTDLYNKGRKRIKEASSNWEIENRENRITLYKLLYGMRAAIEEILLQSRQSIDSVILVQDEPSATPSTTILGITVHSGDLLVSRGGAEVSALISRGNDFPGNFSHVALIYVEETTQTPYLIEAHIERCSNCYS